MKTKTKTLDKQLCEFRWVNLQPSTANKQKQTTCRNIVINVTVPPRAQSSCLWTSWTLATPSTQRGLSPRQSALCALREAASRATKPLIWKTCRSRGFQKLTNPQTNGTVALSFCVRFVAAVHDSTRGARGSARSTALWLGNTPRALRRARRLSANRLPPGGSGEPPDEEGDVEGAEQSFTSFQPGGGRGGRVRPHFRKEANLCRAVHSTPGWPSDRRGDARGNMDTREGITTVCTHHRGYGQVRGPEIKNKGR